jgi:diguanylate cyclase (GGDEF)-like protein
VPNITALEAALPDAERTKLAVLEMLYESTRALGLSRDMGALIDDVLDHAQKLIGAANCGLLLVDADRGTLQMTRVRGFGSRLAHNQTLLLKMDQGLSGWAATHRKAIRVGDVTRDPRYVSGLEDARSNLVVPLILRNEVIGVLSCESSRLDAFTEEHEKMLTVLGTQAALAIEASRANERLEQRIRQLDALYRITQLASEPRDLASLLQSILEITQGAIPEGYCSILLLDQGTRALKLSASRGYTSMAEGLTIALGQGVTGRCAESAQVIVVDDVTQVPDYISGVPGARSEVAVPLLVEGRVMGVLNAESQQPSAYGDDHVRTLSVIAQQVAVVLRAAQLHEETRRLAITDPLTGLYNRRHFIAQLDDHLRRARRYRETLAVVFLDLDDFKTLNDRFGHNPGDRALQAVAAAMRAWVRDTDEVARLGGDEFAALLLQAEGESAWQVVERLRRTVGEIVLTDREGVRIPMTISAGVAMFPTNGVDAESLLQRADNALYAAKRQGKDRVVLSDTAVPGDDGGEGGLTAQA